MSESTELVTVCFAQGQWEAKVIKSRLEADGIQAILRYEAMGPILGVTIGALGRVEIQVAPEDEARAIQVLEDQPPIDAVDDSEGADACLPQLPHRDR